MKKGHILNLAQQNLIIEKRTTLVVSSNCIFIFEATTFEFQCSQTTPEE